MHGHKMSIAMFAQASVIENWDFKRNENDFTYYPITRIYLCLSS